MGPGVTELTYSTPLLVERWENYTLTPGAGRLVGLGTHEPVRGATRFAQNIVHLVALSTGLWLKVCTSMLRKRTSHKRRRPRSKYISRHSTSSGGYKIRRATKFGRSTRLRTTDFESQYGRTGSGKVIKDHST